MLDTITQMTQTYILTSSHLTVDTESGNTFFSGTLKLHLTEVTTVRDTQNSLVTN